MLSINLSTFGLTAENVKKINDEEFVVTKWNWDYQESLAFQEACQKEVYANRSLKILISCSHPYCFTNGKGLQKFKGKVIDGLVDATKDQLNRLPYPLHNIKRGGGLTFHYPGQWIFYPIINLNHPKYNLSDLANKMLITSKDIISNDYSINVETKRGELMGLWSGHNKFASLGQEINRFVTMHGMAISFKNDLQMFSAINTSNPCGLTSSTYQSVESLSNQEISQGCIEDFNNKFLDIFVL